MKSLSNQLCIYIILLNVTRYLTTVKIATVHQRGKREVIFFLLPSSLEEIFFPILRCTPDDGVILHDLTT